MSLTLQFRSSRMTSALHAALIVAEGGKLANEKLQAEMLQPAQALHREMRHIGLTRSALHPTAKASFRFTDDVLALSATQPRHRELARTALMKAVAGDYREEWDPAFAICFRKIEQAFDKAVAENDGQLALRGLPLRQAWETRGPGLVRGIVQWVDPQLLVEEASVTLVYPAMGGAGRAHSRYNAVTMEAMLADPVPEVPEVLRMAWLTTMLNLDLPKFQSVYSAARIIELTELAMLPVVLSAAESVELAACNPATVAKALTAWHVALLKKPDLADLVWRWWETFRDSRPSWNIAIAALDRMLAPENA